MAYSPHNFMAASPEIRRFNGKYYEYTPTKIKDIGNGSAGFGGTVREVTAQEAGPAGQIFNATISPEDWVKNQAYTPVEVKEQLTNTFQGFDPSGKTGWQNQIDVLTQKAIERINANPADAIKALGSVWNEFRYNPAQAQTVQNLQTQNADQLRIASNASKTAPPAPQTTAPAVMDSDSYSRAYKAKFGREPSSAEITDWVNKGRPALEATPASPTVKNASAPPAPAGGANYTVKGGDTLSAIAKKFGVSLADLIAANPGITNPNLIYPNQKIVVPAVGSKIDPNKMINDVQKELQKNSEKITTENKKSELFKLASATETQSGKEPTLVEFKMPSLLESYNKLVNTANITSEKNRIADIDLELSKINADEMRLETDIKNEVEGEAPTSLIRAMVAEKAKLFYPQKVALQAEKEALQTKIANEVDNAKQQFSIMVKDQENGLAYLQKLADSGVTMTAEQYKVADDALGYGAGFTKALVNAQKLANNLKTQTDQLALMDKIVTLQSKLPEGQSFEFNGQKYTSMTDPSKDIQIFEETDKATGKTVIIEYNKKTRAVTVTNTGVKAVTSGGGTAKTPDYFTKPKADGNIGYYFGFENDVKNAQELTAENYLKGKSSAQGVLDPKNSERFITENYIRNMVDEDALREAAKAAGFDKHGSIWSFDKGVGEQDITDYINDLLNGKIAEMRKAGYSDQDIMKDIAE